MGGFALAFLCVALLSLSMLLGRALLPQASSSSSSSPPLTTRGVRRSVFNTPCALAGLSSGAMWAAANVLSVHATMRLGQAVGFPLTQVCVVISSLWGICWFGELGDAKAPLVFVAASSAAVLGGALALKLAGAGLG